MKKNVNKLMAVITTSILVATMSLTAFAANQITIPKKVPTDVNNHTMAPETTFELELTAGPDASTVDLKAGDNTYTYQLTKGTAEQISHMTISGAAFSDITAYPSDGVYQADFAISVPDSIYSVPGVYSYTVKEKNGGYSGITYDANTYYMYVSVVNKEEGGVKVDSVVIAKDNGDKIADITNDFGADGNIDSTHDLTITKSVTGNAGELAKEFTFKISIRPKADTGANANQEFQLKDASGATKNIKADGEATSVTLTNTQAVYIYGLTKDYDVFVSENEAGLNGYTTTYKITDDGAGNTTADQALTDANAKATVNALADGATLTIINHRENVTPTGVAMDIAPYALMIVLAGSAAVTFLRKKEYFEE